MNEKLQRFEDWINTLSIRERLLVVLGAIAVVFLLWDRVLVAPLEARAKQLGEQVKKERASLQTIREQQQQILARAGQDPNKDLRKQIETAKGFIRELDETLKDMTVDLIDPQQMAVVLEEMLVRRSDLNLVRVEALAPQSLGEQIVDDQATTGEEVVLENIPGVYKHTLEIEFTGGYLATLNYIKELESLKRRFYWGSVSYEVKEYPRARVVITVNTLSLNEAWIGA